MRRNGFSLHCKTTTAQQDPEQLIDKLIQYVLHARRLSIKYKFPPSSMIAMDETSANTVTHKQGFLGQFLLGQLAPGQLPPGQLPPRHFPPRTIAPRTIPT